MVKIYVTILLMTLAVGCIPVYDMHVIPDLGLETTEEVMQWVSQNITYKSDGIRDEWQEPHETYNSRTGDCEDFAILALYLMGRGNMETGTNRNKGGHAWVSVDGQHWEPQTGMVDQDLPNRYPLYRRTRSRDEAINLSMIRGIH